MLERAKEARETGRQEKVDAKERDGPREIGQILVTRGTILGTIPLGTVKRMVLRWIRGRKSNLFTGEWCTSTHTSRSPCQRRRCGDERVEECITAPETKVSSHQRGSSPSKLSAHQVSYLAASGADSRGVHHVSGSGWRRLSAIMESDQLSVWPGGHSEEHSSGGH